MLLRNALSLTPCLALFLLACNDNTAHQPAQPSAATPQVATQKDPSPDQPVTTAAEPAKPSATIPINSHHHLYPRHHAMARRADVASADTANAPLGESAEAAQTVPVAATVTVPTGTVLAVRLTQELASKTNTAGDAFTATVSEAVMVDGKPLIPEGSTVSGKITEATPSGTLRQGVLHLTLNSINLNGQDLAIQTSTVSEVDKGKTESASDVVGSAGAVNAPAAGLAGAGTGLGASTGLAGAGTGLAGAGTGLPGAGKSAGLAGAGKSAGMGGSGLMSGAEAKAGTVVAALTGNRDLVFPAQASMKFTLEQSLDIKP